MQLIKQTTPNSPSQGGMSDEVKYEKLIRTVRAEESIRVVGIIEMYRDMLGDSGGEKIAKHILDSVIKTILNNTWKSPSS